MSQTEENSARATTAWSFSPIPSQGLSKQAPQSVTPRLIPMGVLGRGRCCQVSQALDTVRGKPVAVRIVHDDGISDEMTREMFLREMRLLESIRDYSHVIRIYELIDCPNTGKPTQLMEAAPGGTLQNYLESIKEPNSEGALAIALELADGLAAVHAAGIVHHDITPANFVRSDVGWKLTDFTCARISGAYASEECLAPDDTVRQSPYRSPELLNTREIVPYAATEDVYSLGVILLQLFHPPARALCLEAATLERAARIRACALGSLPHPLRLLLVACLELEPECRLVDVVAVRKVLRSLAARSRAPGDREVPVAPPTTVAPPFKVAQDAFLQLQMQHAESCCRDILELDPKHTGAQALLTEIVRRQKLAGQLYGSIRDDSGGQILGAKIARMDEAARVYPGHPDAPLAESLLRAEAASFNMLLRESWAAARQGLLRAALQALDRAMAMHPGAPGLSRARDLAHRFQESWEFFNGKTVAANERKDGGDKERYARALNSFLSGRGLQLLEQMAANLKTIELEATNHGG